MGFSGTVDTVSPQARVAGAGKSRALLGLAQQHFEA